MNRNTSLAVACAAAMMGLAGAAQAVPAIVAPSTPRVIVLQSAPPPPLYEQVPGARPGFVWAPGHYEWRDDRYVWNTGRWIDDRPGWRWQEAQWRQRPDGSWFLVGGQWVATEAAYRDRDRDGDGVRNRNDAFPRDPTRN